MEDNKALSGRVAVVTGGSSGLGKAAALSLAAAGAQVAVLARSRDDLESTLSHINRGGQNGGKAIAVPVDLADAEAISRAVEEVRTQLGAPTILVNAAGTDVPGSVEELDAAAWDRVLNVNLRAVFLLSKEVFPGMRTAGGGTIINVGSVAGRRGWANAGAYCASKFALTGLTQSLAAEGRDAGIRACLLYPGGMDTEWGAWTPSERGDKSTDNGGSSPSAAESLPPAYVADLIRWIVTSPPEMVLNEVTVTPLLEKGWP